MNSNYQNIINKNKRPSSSKTRSKTKSHFFIPVQNKDDQIFLRGETQNHSVSKTINKENQSIHNESKEISNETMNDMYSSIQKMWNNLGITEIYQIQFHNSIKNLEEEQIMNILNNEKKSLNKFRDALMKLSNEIISRDNNIHSLQRNVIALCQNNNYLGIEEDEKYKRNREKNILEIISYVKALRINSINVINYFIRVRELVTYNRNIGKIDMKLINSDFKYRDDYLKKMIRDMDFLKQYKGMHKYFDMNNGDIDAFLTNFDSKPSNNLNYSKYISNKAKIPVSEQMKKAIIECRYILTQEEIYNRISQGIYERDNNDNNISNIINENLYRNNNINNKKGKSKIRFFKPDDENQKEYPNIYETNNNNVNNKKLFRIKNNNSSGKILNVSKDNNNMQERKKLEFLRLNMGKEYNNLFINNKQNNNKFQNKNYVLSNNNNNELNFRRPLLNGNKIIIHREERKKEPIQFVLKNDFALKKDPLLKENIELNKNLAQVCEDNEQLREEINNLKEKIIQLNKDNSEQQTFNKKLSSDIDELNLVKNDLNIKLKSNQNLFEKIKKDNTQTINNLNSIINKQKEDYEKKITNLNAIMQNQKEEAEKNINDLNFQKDELIKEKNDLINQNNQLLKEKNELIETKNNLEDTISQLEYQISENKKEIENYKNIIIANQQKIGEMEQKINELNNDLINLQNEKNIQENEFTKKIDELSNQINDLEKTIQNNQEQINNLESLKNQLIKEKQNLFDSDNNAKIQINNLNEQINNLNKQINVKDEQINSLQSNLNDYSELKKENNQMKNLINNQKNEINELNEKLKKLMPNYTIDFYRGNLFNFINDISDKLSLDKIPDFMKASFNLEEINIFDESTYLKGVYPKIIVSKLENTGEITGMCSVYYENYGYVGDPLTLRIDALCVVEQNWEFQIKNIINFIKSNIFFDEIKYIIKYIPNPENGKLKLDERIKTFFKKELKCSWKNVINFANGTRTQEIRLVKEGDYFNKDINITNNEQFFGLKSLSIISLYEKNKDKTYIGDDPEIELKNKYSKIFLNKYINHFPIFLLLANNPNYKMNFENETDKKLYEIPKCKEEEDYLYPKTQIKELVKMNFNLDNISELKNNIELFDTNNLLCEEVYEKLNSYLNKFSLNYLTMTINLSTPTNFCLNFENYIYNRISSKKIDVLRDPSSKNLFYLIPTNNDSIFIFISQIGPKLKEKLLDNNKNLYQALSELHPKLTNQLIQFSSFNITLDEQKNREKVLYIPSFKIDSHLYSFGVKDINKKGKLTYTETNEEENLGSIDECFKLSFDGDKNIKDSFNIIPVEDKKLNMIIRESFLFGIFNINIIENSPLQLFYVTKDHWISAQ